MRKNLVLIASVVTILWLGQASFTHVSKLMASNIWGDILTRSYLEESRTPSIAEIEEFTRMKLPKGYRNLKALFHIETRDGITEEMNVKLSANRSEIKKALSAAGFSEDLEANPEWRRIKNGAIEIPWWKPDGEKNVLSGSYRKKTSKGHHWDVAILLALQEKEPDTLYVYGFRIVD